MSNATSENRFKIEFTDFKSLNATALSGQIPERSHTSTPVNFSGEIVKTPGDSSEIGELVIMFKLLEDYSNYITIYNWMQNNITNCNVPNLMQFDTIEYLILNAGYKPILSFTYGYVFPTVIDAIDHTSQTGTADELEFNVSFQVNTIKINSNI